MRTIVAGSSGLIGAALVDLLREHGHEVQRLVRRPVERPDEVSWDPAAGRLDPTDLVGTDAVVNLGGAGIGDRRWTDAYKKTLRSSRLDGTSLLASTLAATASGPRILVNASAMGYYGDRGDEVLDEGSSPGTGFLPELVVDWEAATQPAAESGVRVVRLRTGLVLSPDGGALSRLLPLVRLGLGGRLGPGTQYWSWVTLPDTVRAIAHLLTTEVAGPVNIAAPEPVTNAELVAALAEAHRRPAFLAVPAWAMRIALGELADDVLTSARMSAQALLDSGFGFEHPTVPDAMAWLTGTPAAGRRSGSSAA